MSYFGGVSVLDGDFAPTPGKYLGVAPEFTTVLYRPHDPLGLVAALASLVPAAVLVAHLSVFLCRRLADDLWFACGQVLNEALNVLVKYIVRQKRPDSPVLNMPTDTYGMPSSHAQFMGFAAGYMLLRLRASPQLPALDREIRRVLIVSVALFVAFSRYYLWYHSATQVFVGAVVGILHSLIWYAIGRLFHRKGVWRFVFPIWPLSLFSIKDVTYDVRQEYIAWLKRSRD